MTTQQPPLNPDDELKKTPRTDAIRLVIAAGDWRKESDCTDCALSHAETLERELHHTREVARRLADALSKTEDLTDPIVIEALTAAKNEGLLP